MSQQLPLMRKATAVWLIENTCLTFEQIAKFCGLHDLEIKGIADGDIASGIIGKSPIDSGQLTEEEIKRCESNPDFVLVLRESIASTINTPSGTKKPTKYTPIARRDDKPDAILYLLKYYPDITNKQIKKLIGTTDSMIESIRAKTHWNIKNIKPRDAVLLGLCTQSQFNQIILNAAPDEGEESPKTKAKSKAKPKAKTAVKPVLKSNAKAKSKNKA